MMPTVEAKSYREIQLEAENSRLRELVDAVSITAREREDQARQDVVKAKRELVARDNTARELLRINANLLTSHDFMWRLLEHSGDCIKVLNLEGRLQFMSAGGLRVMEIDDIEPFIGCHWVDFWSGEENDVAQNALVQARSGGTGRFQGMCKTAKGTPKWWDVQVTAINGDDGKPEQILSISRDITEIKQAEINAQLLAEELNHRVKNTLAMVQAIANQTLRDQSDGKAREIFSARLLALGKAHDILVQGHWASAGLHAVIAGVTEPFNDTARIRVDGPDIQLSAKPALALSLAFHELCTNAVKHGALSNRSGAIDITWGLSPADDGLRMNLHWREHGGPPVMPPTRKGFGSRLIERGLIAELGGEVHNDYAPSGLICRINAPLSAMRRAA